MVLEKDSLISQNEKRPKAFGFWASSDIHSRWIIALSLIFIVFGYLPTLQFDYVTQDQWRAFRYSTAEMTPTFRAESCVHDIPSFYVLTGRPLVWPSECLEHTVVGRISDFAYLRPIVLLVALVTALYLGWVLSPILGSVPLGVMAAAVFIFSPGYSFMFLQGMTGVMVLLSVIVAAASFHTLRSLLDRALNRERIRPTEFTMPFILFLAGCFIYPVWTFMVITLSLLEFGFNNKISISHRARKLAANAIFYFIGSIIYYISVKISSSLLLHFLKNYTLDPNYKVSIEINPTTISARLSQLWKVFYDINPSNFLTFPGLSLIILVVFSIFANTSRTRTSASGIISALCAILLTIFASISALFGAISPWIFSQMNSPNTFFMAPWYLFFSAATIGIVYATMKKLPARLHTAAPYALLAIIVAPIAAEQNKISYAQALVSDYEIWAMGRGLNHWVEKKGYETQRYLLVILPRGVFPDFPQRYMFGSADLEENAVLSSSQNLVSIPWMINSLLRRYGDLANSLNIVNCGFDQNCANYNLLGTNNVVLGVTRGETPVVAAQKPFVIDLSQLTTHPASLKIEILHNGPLPRISASSQLGPYGPQGLLGNIEPGWHAAPPTRYPQTLTFDFYKQKTISRIGFLPQDGLAIRAPRNIEIETSADGRSWHTESSADLSCIGQGDYRYLQLTSPIKTQYLRIDILKNCGDPTYLTLRGIKLE